METYNHIITNGPNKWDLMLALFDSEDRQRLVSFTAESERHRELEAKHDSGGGYKGLTREEQIEVETFDLNIGPYEMKVIVHSVARNSKGWWHIIGVDMETLNEVTLGYNTQTRKGKVKIVETNPDPKNQDLDFEHHHRQVDFMATCEWCRKSVKIEEMSQTFDNETICFACWQRDQDGTEIAKFGRAQYEAENEPERVVDADGKVDYE